MARYDAPMSSRNPVEDVRGCLEDALDRFSDFHKAVDADLAFGPDLDPYFDDVSPEEKRLDRIKPRDPGTVRILRYKEELGLKRFPVTIETRAEVPGVSPQEVEAARRAIESVVFDPLKRYAMHRRRMFLGGLGARAWAIHLQYTARHGLSFKSEHPKTTLWCEGFLHPQEEENPWMIRTARVRTESLVGMKGWRVPRDLKPDDGKLGGQSIVPKGAVQGSTGYAPAAKDTDYEGFTTLAIKRLRFQPTGKRQRREKGYIPLEDDMRYMACAGCGWKSETQVEAMASFPEKAECPECGDQAVRQDAHAMIEDGVPYPGGQRMIVCAPYSGHEEPFYDGAWEFPYRCFPVAFFQPYPLPHKEIGLSDTHILKSIQQAKNAMLRNAYETMIRSKPRWKMPTNGAVKNVFGQPFTFSARDGDIMLYDGPSGDIEVIQGQGVRAEVLQLMDRLDSYFRTNESTSELALSPSQIKDAKVGTVDQVTETGNVVLDGHGRLLYEAEADLWTCINDAQRGMPSKMTPYMDARGVQRFQRVGGPTTAPVRMVVGGGQLHELDNDEIQAFNALAQMAPEMRIAFAQWKHIDPSVLLSIPMPPPAAPVGPGGAASPPQPGEGTMPDPMMNGAANG